MSFHIWGLVDVVWNSAKKRIKKMEKKRPVGGVYMTSRDNWHIWKKGVACMNNDKF
jgi:hypothetical protein